MDKENRQSTDTANAKSTGEYKLVGLIKYLVSTDLEWIGRVLLKLLLFKWRRRSLRTENNANKGTAIPAGPFVATRKAQAGDLLLWVPRRIESYLIDELTGGYGYSHITIDTGEVDTSTMKPVMAEITIGQTVTRKFLDEYGQRPYVRLPLSRIGVDSAQFVECAKSKMGEQYDAWDAITLGEIEEPAKEICSGLAADCLPEEERRRIAEAARLGLVHKDSISVHSKRGALKIKEFISPNGFAEYYCVPKGRKITEPDVFIQPHPVEISVKNITRRWGWHYGWKTFAGFLVIVLLALVLKPIARRAE